MPLQSVSLAPGTNAEITPTQGVAQIISSQLIRFRYAGQQILAEKLGGWKKFYGASLGSAIRALHAWEGINADTHLGVGCVGSLNVITAGSEQDITPRTATTNPAVSFTTTSTSETVSVDDASFVATTFDSIYLLTPVSVGGFVLQGAYAITSVVTSSKYTIQAASPATASVTAGGAVPQFTTTNGASTVTVTLANHGYLVGEIFPVPTPTTVGGITFSGAYVIQTVPNANTFTIVATSTATSGTSGFMNGGNASIIYFVGLGPTALPLGYGLGSYGGGGYGTGLTPAGSTGTAITATNWTLDNWGEILLACPTGGAIYQWSPDSGFTNAIKVVNAPLINGGIFVAQPAQILVAWGSSNSSVVDPLQINWSDSGDYTNWTVASTTQAGGFRLPTGSKIMGGINGPSFNIIWTDLDVWSMDYIQPPLVYGFNALASNCGLIARHAMGVMDSTVYWMGPGQFYRMDGETVQIIPCPVWDAVFQNLDQNNVDKITCAPNSLFGEMAWYYPSKTGGGEIDSYVKMSTVIPNCWDFGLLARTAWIDQSVLGQPIGASPDGYVYQHETSPDADGQPMVSNFTTGYFEIADGENLSFVDWLFPDFKWGDYNSAPAAIVQMTLSFTDYPNGTVKARGPYAVSSTVPYINTRLRGRLAALSVGSSDLGSFWRMGGVKIRSAPDGKR